MTKRFASLLLCVLGAANAESDPMAVTTRLNVGAQPDPPRACCYAMTADCLSCAEGVSVAEFCANPTNSHYAGCESSKAVPETFHRGPSFPAPTGGGMSCPVGLSWAGTGHYCLHNDLYYCTSPNGSPRLVEQCRGTCQHNPPGVADRCSTSGGNSGGGYCYSNQQCGYGQVCSRGVCVPGGSSGWCRADYECGRYQSCRNGQCVSHGNGGGGGNYQCYSSRDCPRYGDVCTNGRCQPSWQGPGNGGNYRCGHNNDCSFGQVCLLGQCQAVLPGAGQCNSCDNSGCGFGERCVHEGNDYSCNGVCRRGNGGGNNGRPQPCSVNNDCGWGAVCLVGTCRPLWS